VPAHASVVLQHAQSTLPSHHSVGGEAPQHSAHTPKVVPRALSRTLMSCPSTTLVSL
jgi:hypothetical protein